MSVTKAELRTRMRALLRALAPADVATWSAAIVAFLQAHPERWLGDGRVVALFGGIPGEPDLLPMVPWLCARGGVPVWFGCEGDDLVPRWVRAITDLVRGPFGIFEPAASAPFVAFADLDVVLTPALAFGPDGVRLGRGRGYFDRLFARPEVRARRVGVGFEVQRVPFVPADPHDRRVEALVTENGRSECPATC
ncbi:MAG: 5-formyltetrahydrofolate cyclo-ligase [Planctomycetes bacterium]|nr:5-formyltetrahydrofolate cyclo-ligase [Planctomycetota bacterium]